MSGIASVDSPHSLSASFTGPMLFSSGLALDSRPDCSLYSRTSLSLLASGSVSCALARLMIRKTKIVVG
jgi:NADH:ubiquinone oxidoreductase subunit D